MRIHTAGGDKKTLQVFFLSLIVSYVMPLASAEEGGGVPEVNYI